MASSRIKTYGTNGTFVGIPGGHPVTSLLGVIIVGAAAGYVGRSMGSEAAMLILGTLGGIAGYLGGDAIGNSIQEFYRSEERRG